jgi:GTP cyclohydrolase I
MVDRRAAARAIEDFLRALGHAPGGELEGDLAGTGERVADAWADDLLEGESIDARAVLREGSMDVDGRGGLGGLVVIRDLAVTTMCPHHLLPAFGAGVVAYLPGARLAGIGTLAHVLDALSRRLTLQERIGAEVAELLVEELGARGALCKLSLTHTCLVARGERKAGAVVETLAVSGAFAHASPERDLAFAALARSGGA